jgi:hypothetical protein
VPGFKAPSHPDGLAEASLLVDDVQEIEYAPISAGIELEYHDSHLMGMLSPVTPHRAIAGPNPLTPGCGPLQPFLPLEPFHPFNSRSSLLAAAAGMPSGAPANVLIGDLVETIAQLGILQVDDLFAVVLRPAVLAQHTANHVLRCLVTVPQNPDGSTATSRAQQFPSSPSLSISFSSSASDNSFLSRAFPFPS